MATLKTLIERARCQLAERQTQQHTAPLILYQDDSESLTDFLNRCHETEHCHTSPMVCIYSPELGTKVELTTGRPIKDGAVRFYIPDNRRVS